MRRYTLAELQALPTLAVGQADDLKLENFPEPRVWLSRCTTADGEPYDHKVTVERFDGARWRTVEEYQAS